MTRRVILAMALFFLVALAGAGAGEVVLKNGNVIRGRIVRVTDESVVVEIEAGDAFVEMTFPRKDVKTIRRSPDFFRKADLPLPPGEAEPPGRETSSQQTDKAPADGSDPPAPVDGDAQAETATDRKDDEKVGEDPPTPPSFVRLRPRPPRHEGQLAFEGDLVEALGRRGGSLSIALDRRARSGRWAKSESATLRGGAPYLTAPPGTYRVKGTVRLGKIRPGFRASVALQAGEETVLRLDKPVVRVRATHNRLRGRWDVSFDAAAGPVRYRDLCGPSRSADTRANRNPRVVFLDGRRPGLPIAETKIEYG